MSVRGYDLAYSTIRDKDNDRKYIYVVRKEIILVMKIKRFITQLGNLFLGAKIVFPIKGIPCTP